MITKTLSLTHLIQPPKINAEKSPLFLLIHGYGADEKDLFGFAKNIPDEFCVISIQAPIKLDFGGYAWYELNFTNPEKISNIHQAIESKNKIIQFIDEVIEAYSVDKNKIWLCGFSQGCILSYALAFSYPEKIHRMIGMSGYPDKAMFDLPNQATIKQIKFFISHGQSDAVIPVFMGRSAKELLNKMEANFVYKEYLGGHGIDQENYFDIINWINENKTN
jgi:phospholipase/carboxylesterase